MVIHGTLNGHDFSDLAGGEFVEGNVTVSDFVGGGEEVNPLFPNAKLALRME